MVFSSISFLFYFLPIVLGLYFLAPLKMKNYILLIASLFFYAWGEPVYVVLMIVSILLNYVVGLFISGSHPKFTLVIGVIINISVLAFFKYADFIIETINSIFSTGFANLDLPLPIGISFYTFQAMSYIIDLYKKEVKLQKNIIDFATYVALFPQLIAGPIVRLKSIENQLHTRTHSWALFSLGIRRFVIGLGKKVLIANNMGLIWEKVSAGDLSQLPVLSAWLGIIAFTAQIYFDFSGYSDMAIGLGKMFGFDFPENFRYPYTAKSITDFWRKWHISLSTWFKEYVYIPLGGNKKGLLRQLLNIFIVWLLTGLWHGAAWNFVLWGLFFAVFLLIEKVFLLKLLNKTPSILNHIYTMIIVMMSWVIFSLENVSDIVTYFSALFGITGAGFASSASIYLLTNNLILIILAAFGATQLPSKIGNTVIRRLDNRPILTIICENVWMILLLIACTAYIIASSYNPFLYFRF